MGEEQAGGGHTALGTSHRPTEHSPPRSPWRGWWRLRMCSGGAEKEFQGRAPVLHDLQSTATRYAPKLTHPGPTEACKGIWNIPLTMSTSDCKSSSTSLPCHPLSRTVRLSWARPFRASARPRARVPGHPHLVPYHRTPGLYRGSRGSCERTLKEIEHLAHPTVEAPSPGSLNRGKQRPAKETN